MFPKALILLSVLALDVCASIIPETAHADGVNSVRPASCVRDNCKCSKLFNGIECHGNYIYQCGASGYCCNWGYRATCAKCGDPNKCPPAPTPTASL